jgi:uncharacterized protein (TIGR03382 family)
MKSKTCLLPGILLAIGSASLVPAATVTWDGDAGNGLWKTATNWSGNALPAAGDTVIIGAGNTVVYDGGGQLPGNITLNLDGILSNAGQGAIRMNNTNMTVGSTGVLYGPADFWDLDDADIVFHNGAQTTIRFWENKDVNTFKFILGSSGFSTLTPERFYVSTGSIPGNISNATYTVDMAAYTGGTGIITLVDYTIDAATMDNTKFQTATLNVINAGSYTANLQWNDTTEAVELNITAVPEPAPPFLAGLGALAVLLWRRRRM